MGCASVWIRGAFERSNSGSLPMRVGVVLPGRFAVAVVMMGCLHHSTAMGPKLDAQCFARVSSFGRSRDQFGFARVERPQAGWRQPHAGA